MPCAGHGECFEQCGCYCYLSEEDDTLAEVCECGHRDHNTFDGGDQQYCKSANCSCELQPCHNFWLCGKKLPQWLLGAHLGMCLDCALTVGKIKQTGVKGECPICYDLKDLIELSCRHRVCLECWKQVGETCEAPAKCPLCRKGIWK